MTWRVVNWRLTWQRIWECILYGVYWPANDLELIPTVKMETRNPMEGYFDSAFPAICNHCAVIAARSRKTLKIWEIVRYFCKKTTPYGKIFKIVPNVLIASLIDELCSNFMKFGRRKISKIVLCLPDKKISPGSPALANMQIAPKICQGQPPTVYLECSRFYPNRFTFGGVISERVNTAKTHHKVNPIFNWSLASSRIKG